MMFEELQELIAELSDVVQGLTTNLNTIATQGGAITASAAQQPSQPVSDPVVPQNPNLRLPTLQLPTF